MEDTNTDAPEVLETPEPEAEAVETTEAVDERDSKIAQLEKEKSEVESKNKQLYERLKKAETKPDVLSSEALSNKDLLYLAKADIHTEDVDEVLELAKLKKWDVAKAHTYLKPVLQERTEERKTANTTQTTSRRGVAKVSGQDLLSKFDRTGEMPESDEGMAELFKARTLRRLGKN